MSHAVWAAIGGASKFLLGVDNAKEFWREVAILLIIAIPVGMLAGSLVADYGASAAQSNAASIACGLFSLNLVKGALKLNFEDIKDIIRLIFKRWDY